MSDAPTRDTIVAIATPPGRGGIGVVRLSGPGALTIATPLLRLRAPLDAQRARFCEVLDPATEPPTKLDEAITTYYPAPHSYTGEHVIEIAAHGAPVLLDFLLRQCVASGARLANPGEFTERAFFSGRLDLTQAEAVRDLIDAQTIYQARVAASQLDGALSRRVAPIKAALIALIAQLEAGIDFADDDTPTLAPAQILAHATPIAGQLATLAHSFEHGRLVHQGLSLAIIGEPNVGKSSLFNALVERDRAIVTAFPGTTRDLVTERISLGGLPVELIDTAGIREADPSAPHQQLTEPEQIGIRKSIEAGAEADLVLLVLDAAQALESAIFPLVRACAASTPLASENSEPEQTADSSPQVAPPHLDIAQADSDSLHPGAQTSSASSNPALLTPSSSPATPNLSLQGRHVILVLNKSDLLAAPPTSKEQLRLQVAGLSPQTLIVLTSAITGAGIAELRTAITAQFQAPAAAEPGLLTNLRQHQAVTAAIAALSAAIAAVPTNTPHEMLLLDLYTALTALDSLTGATTPDDILNLIFSTFCIGK